MNSSSLAGIITAVATVITALGGFALALGVLIPILRITKEAKRASVQARDMAVSTGVKADAVHKIVNQQRTDMLRYTEALVRALKSAGVEVPVDQSIPAAELEKQP